MKVKVIVSLSVILLIFIIWRLNILSIEKVNLSNFAECVSTDDLNREINSLDKNLILINSDKFKNQLTYKFKCIKDVSVTYEFPRAVRISIYGRKFLAKVISSDIPPVLSLESSPSSEAALLDWNFPGESSEDAYIVDDTGFVFTKVKHDYPAPIIFLADNLSFNTQFDRQAFKSIDQIFSKIMTFTPISYQPNFRARKYGNTLLINTSPKLAFSLEKDILKQLASLQLILQKAKIDERVAEFIDLRFDKPVVQYRTK